MADAIPELLELVTRQRRLLKQAIKRDLNVCWTEDYFEPFSSAVIRIIGWMWPKLPLLSYRSINAPWDDVRNWIQVYERSKGSH